MTPHKANRSRFSHSINVINSAHPVRMARLDFFGSVTLVVGIGMIAKLVQALLAH